MSYRLRVNPITCDAHGVCAELLPEIIGLDPWGYPVLPADDLPAELIEHARLAATACPTLALLVDKVPRRHTGGYDAGTAPATKAPQRHGAGKAPRRHG